MRPLRADEIEVRVGQVYEGKVSMLLYKTARTDMTILDEMYGAFGWQCDYREVKGNMYCGIGVFDESKSMWVWKWDCGTESNTEKEKGEASDAMKRAGVKWGIGRELYTAPRIYLDAATVPFNDKSGYTRYKLHNPRELNGIFVSHIRTDEVNGRLEIVELELSQKAYRDVKVIYTYPKGGRK